MLRNFLNTENNLVNFIYNFLAAIKVINSTSRIHFIDWMFPFRCRQDFPLHWKVWSDEHWDFLLYILPRQWSVPLADQEFLAVLW